MSGLPPVSERIADIAGVRKQTSRIGSFVPNPDKRTNPEMDRAQKVVIAFVASLNYDVLRGSTVSP
jgi:hypothetical protein